MAADRIIQPTLARSVGAGMEATDDAVSDWHSYYANVFSVTSGVCPTLAPMTKQACRWIFGFKSSL